MKKLPRSRWIVLLVVAAFALTAVAPAGASAAGDGSGGVQLLAETATEAPTETTAPEAAPPASTGWVPQGAGTESAGAVASPTQQGSSLGSGDSGSSGGSGDSSGGGSSPAGSTEEAPSSTTTTTAPSPSTYVEPESSVSPTFEDPAAAPQVGTETDSAPPPARTAPAETGAKVAVGAADLVSEPPPVTKTAGAAPTPTPASLVAPSDEGGSGSGSLLLPFAILLGLVLLGLGAYHGLRRWRHHRRWQSEATEWNDAVSRLDRERALREPKPSRRKVRAASAGAPEFVLRDARPDAKAGRDPRPARAK